MFEIHSDLSKTDLKIYYSCQHKKGQKMAKWPNHFISDKQYQKGQMATLVFIPFFEVTIYKVLVYDVNRGNSLYPN